MVLVSSHALVRASVSQTHSTMIWLGAKIFVTATPSATASLGTA
jgi:hypothetical protein